MIVLIAVGIVLGLTLSLIRTVFAYLAFRDRRRNMERIGFLR